MNLEKWAVGLVWAVISAAGGGLVAAFTDPGGCVAAAGTHRLWIVAAVTGAVGGVSYLKDSRPTFSGIDIKRFTAGAPPAHS